MVDRLPDGLKQVEIERKGCFGGLEGLFLTSYVDVSPAFYEGINKKDGPDIWEKIQSNKKLRERGILTGMDQLR